MLVEEQKFHSHVSYMLLKTLNAIFSKLRFLNQSPRLRENRLNDSLQT